jgi:3-deoxy-D-manno-octulosonate 8-phosphate phosphatase (KDO 8-P phosphatase)
VRIDTPDIERRVRHIKLLLMDCDGVLTDGRIWLTAEGDEQKAFHVHDGQGIGLFHRAGLRTGIISGRRSDAVARRVEELKISFVRQDANDKVKAFEEILAEAEVSADECAYIGDDIADIPLMQRVEVAIAVADAADETKEAAHYVTRADGGCGAVREVCEIILKVQGRWDELMRPFRA